MTILINKIKYWILKQINNIRRIIRNEVLISEKGSPFKMRISNGKVEFNGIPAPRAMIIRGTDIQYCKMENDE